MEADQVLLTLKCEVLSKKNCSCCLKQDGNQTVEAKIIKCGEIINFHICLLRFTDGEEGSCAQLWELTSGTQEAPAHVDGGGEEAVPLGAAVAAADHDVMSEGDAACRHAAVSCVIGQWAADTTHQTTWKGSKREGEKRFRDSLFSPPQASDLLQSVVTLQYLQLLSPSHESCSCDTAQHTQRV